MADKRKPSPINPNTLAPSVKRSVRIPKDIREIGYYFIGVVVVASVIYYFGAPYGFGIKPTFQITEGTAQVTPSVNYWDCLHFSVVTIATLGYGDYRNFGDIELKVTGLCDRTTGQLATDTERHAHCSSGGSSGLVAG